jgi:hypothetical protein
MDVAPVMVKFFVEDGSRFDLGEIIPIFHDWIRNHRLDELLIDVADYRHVYQGPGVMLACHGGFYSMDQFEGRLGLQYTRKEDHHGPPERPLETAFRAALLACTKLEEEASLRGRIKFRGDEVLFRVNDRLRAPNTPATFSAVRGELEALTARLYAGKSATVSRRTNPAELFGVEIKSDTPIDASTLLQRLQPG